MPLDIIRALINEFYYQPNIVEREKITRY